MAKHPVSPDRVPNSPAWFNDNRVAFRWSMHAVEQFQFVQLLVIMHPRDRLDSIFCILLLVSLEVWDDLGALLASFSNLNLCCFNHY
uniref:Uncharacterized protein n=1 Tax=Oryza meridionalis TaxID=40149 RepID=A0A0E0DHD9_9ORYZ